MKKTKKVRVPVRTIEDYIQIFNGILRLTPRELEVLAVFLRIQRQLERKGMPISPFSTEMKKLAAKKLKWSDFNALNVYIKRLHDKGAIQRTQEDYAIISLLVPKGETGVLFSFGQS
jgi:hypothetical protein